MPLATVAALTGRRCQAIGLTTFRPPYTPVTFGAFAGPSARRCSPPCAGRRSPRPARCWRMSAPGSARGVSPSTAKPSHAAVGRECLAVRNDVGMLDASTLGKIEVVGPDAAMFLSRLYTGDFTRLAPGRCRYAVLLGRGWFHPRRWYCRAPRRRSFPCHHHDRRRRLRAAPHGRLSSNRVRRRCACG